MRCVISGTSCERLRGNWQVRFYHPVENAKDDSSTAVFEDYAHVFDEYILYLISLKRESSVHTPGYEESIKLLNSLRCIRRKFVCPPPRDIPVEIPPQECKRMRLTKQQTLADEANVGRQDWTSIFNYFDSL